MLSIRSMWFQREPDVLVVGGGPVGLIAAVLLADQDLRVELIDERLENAASGLPDFPLLLHPSTIEQLFLIGAGPDVLAKGARIDRIAIYDRDRRISGCAVGAAGAPYPFALAVRHRDLVDALTACARRHNAKISTGRRLAEVEQGNGRATARIEKLTVDSGGLVVDGPLFVVSRSYKRHPRFVVGADGPDSCARRSAQISMTRVAAERSYVMASLDDAPELMGEMRIVANDGALSAVWPTPDGGCRWIFEVAEDTCDDRDLRHRRSWRPEIVSNNEVVNLLRSRARWFLGRPTEDDLAIRVRVEPAVSLCFGLGRIWLAGDAAHVTNPMGTQSLNAAVAELPLLAALLHDALGASARARDLYEYDEGRMAMWNALACDDGSLPWTVDTARWTLEKAHDIVSCLPATGPALVELAAAFGIRIHMACDVNHPTIPDVRRENETARAFE